MSRISLAAHAVPRRWGEWRGYRLGCPQKLHAARSGFLTPSAEFASSSTWWARGRRS
jgi:hypothetical protein